MKHKHPILKALFWQPKTDFLAYFEHGYFQEISLIILNYSVWVLLFYFSYKLIYYDFNYFGRLLVATLIAELLERYLKKRRIWLRPLFNRHQSVPRGLVNSWYYSGSFPSGHTMKVVYFLLFLLPTGIFSLSFLLIILIPLLIFRVLVGFHYPIDIAGGIVMGILLWFLTKNLLFPDIFNNFFIHIFNFIFLIK